MKIFFAAAIFIVSTILSRAEMTSAIPLCSTGAPGVLATTGADIPTLTPYLLDGTNATGAVMVIYPGGSYANGIWAEKTAGAYQRLPK